MRVLESLEKPCLFKIADGTVLFTDDCETDEFGASFNMAKTYIIVSKTNDKRETALTVYPGSAMMYKPSFLYFPWSSIISASDMEEAGKDSIRRAALTLVPPVKEEKEVTE